MPNKKILFALVGSLVVMSFPSFAANPAAPVHKMPGPCKMLEISCVASGFSKGDWKKGNSLWSDCLNPISQGIAKVPGATRPLPPVDPTLVAACKAQHPKYGMGTVGSR